jgi:two-component system, OmpR family, response regulator RpaB
MTIPTRFVGTDNERQKVYILVVEDDIAIQKMLRLTLERIGHRVAVVGTGAEALQMLRSEPIELVLLDIMLPDTNGFEVCRKIRAFSDVPLVILTALNRTEDIVRGFDMGADDYVTKPFSLREIEGRIDAILRRVRMLAQQPLTEQISLNGVTLNERTQTVTIGDDLIHLTPIEYRLLQYLMQRADRPISKRELFEHVWGYGMTGDANLVEVAIRRLRNKVEETPATPARIVTVHTAGYKFVTHGDT